MNIRQMAVLDFPIHTEAASIAALHSSLTRKLNPVVPRNSHRSLRRLLFLLIQESDGELGRMLGCRDVTAKGAAIEAVNRLGER